VLRPFAAANIARRCFSDTGGSVANFGIYQLTQK
jgi:hypothetical protein